LILCCIAVVNGLELRVNSARVASLSSQARWKSNNKANERNVEGIITATDGGLFVMSLNSPTHINVTSKIIYGLSFDWNSRKMYWVEQGVGIMRSNVDGSGYQMLLADVNPFGVAVEPITGNVYYGSRSRQAIRVCNNEVNRCSTIATSSDMANVEDIAFHMSKGLLFWSIYRSWSPSKIVRANIDGTNATVISERPTVLGLDVDENDDRLYWTDHKNKEIGSCDLNGQHISMLPNIHTTASDVEIDGENFYFTNYQDKSVYSTTQRGLDSTLIVSLQERARRIALFGRRLSSPKPNPCEFNECDHLCILTSRSTYRCLCPDDEQLQDDGLACKM